MRWRSDAAIAASRQGSLVGPYEGGTGGKLRCPGDANGADANAITSRAGSAGGAQTNQNTGSPAAGHLFPARRATMQGSLVGL
jgi:hypothetical protein